LCEVRAHARTRELAIVTSVVDGLRRGLEVVPWRGEPSSLASSSSSLARSSSSGLAPHAINQKEALTEVDGCHCCQPGKFRLEPTEPFRNRGTETVSATVGPRQFRRNRSGAPTWL